MGSSTLSLQTILCSLWSSGWTRIIRYILAMSATMATAWSRKRSAMSSKSSCTTGPTMSASFRATPVDVRHEASNTTRSFVVVLSGLKTQWCGRSGFADSRFSSPRKRLMAVDLDSPRRWTAYFFLGSVTTNLPVSSRTVVSSNSCSHVDSSIECVLLVRHVSSSQNLVSSSSIAATDTRDVDSGTLPGSRPEMIQPNTVLCSVGPSAAGFTRSSVSKSM
uniref:(northern house mosquito) hypothetical protein n=1 Tax=Culex pipiens TaxID=7175 RepID=A0A8D8C7E3_CULPI